MQQQATQSGEVSGCIGFSVFQLVNAMLIKGACNHEGENRRCLPEMDCMKLDRC